MKSLHGVWCLGVLALVLSAAACQSISVAPWPYTIDGGDDGAPTDSASPDAGDLGMTGAGGDQATKGGSVPVRCDGGLCSTDNFSLCTIADSSAARSARLPVSVLVGGGIGLAVALKRHRRKARGSS
jgi:hypothetical protein